jgi:hypothetical protein
VDAGRAGSWGEGARAGDARVGGGARRECAGLSREPTDVPFVALRAGEEGVAEGGEVGGVPGRAIRLETAGECGGKFPFRNEPDGDAGRGKVDVMRETCGGTGASSAPGVLEGPGIRRKRSSTCV